MVPPFAVMGLVLRRIACYVGLGVAVWACGENSGNSHAPANPSAGAAGQPSSGSPNAAEIAGTGGNQQAGGNTPATGGGTATGGTAQPPSAGGRGALGAAGASGGQGASGSATECPETPARPPSAGARLELPVRFTSGGVPLTVGEPAHDSLGEPYRVTLLKIFLSRPELETETGERVPAAFADVAGNPLLYGLHLLDLEDVEPKLRMIVAPGQYTALHLTVGLPEGCNGGDPTRRKFPLNADSDMYWSWGSSYLFVRFEGQSLGEPTHGFSYHLGALGEGSEPRGVRLEGALLVGESGGPSSIAISLDVGKVIAPAPEDSASVGPHQISAPWMLDHIGQDAFSLGPEL
ncbi:MAG TPA: MbnP family protein [Polyangiaceae bacterium]|nr:MbnP family protein [Polyangiaceae bacterium]